MSITVAAPRVRVLVVDDYADDLCVFCKMLETWGCETLACGSPCDAVRLAREFHPQLVVLDLAMPEKSGFELATELLRAGLPPFLLVARTGFAGDENRRRCFEVGFDEFLVKPEPLDKLRALIAQAGQLIAAPVA